jgi:hypothetical protein
MTGTRAGFLGVQIIIILAQGLIISDNNMVHQFV